MVTPVFDIQPEVVLQPVSYTMIKYHIVFDVKLSMLQRIACLVADGYMSEPPSAVTYSSVVSHESIQNAFTLAALNA